MESVNEISGAGTDLQTNARKNPNLDEGGAFDEKAPLPSVSAPPLSNPNIILEFNSTVKEGPA